MAFATSLGMVVSLVAVSAPVVRTEIPAAATTVAVATTAAAASVETTAAISASRPEAADVLGAAGAQTDFVQPRRPQIFDTPGTVVDSIPFDTEADAEADAGLATVAPVPTSPDTTTAEDPGEAGDDTPADFGRPVLWLQGFDAGAAAVAAWPGDGLPVVERPLPEDSLECYRQARTIDLRPDGRSWDRNALATMVHELFGCVMTVEGLADVPATKTGRWDGAAVWGFESLADQVAAEAVVVSYCESVGFQDHALRRNNPWGYGGMFQMGSSEMRRFGSSGMSKFDPVDNTYAAANYFLYMYRTRRGWGGWGPWAVVNTNFNDEVNNQVRVPVLPRFSSTEPGYRGRRGPELPAWAVTPTAFEVPAWAGCPYNGGRWPTAQPLAP